MRVRSLVALVLLVLVSTPPTAFGQTITQQQADEILKELRAIRQTLEVLAQRPTALPAPQRPAEQRVKVSTTGNALGREDSPITVVEFTDLQCPFCSRFATTTFDQLKKAYIDTGKVRFVSRDLPLESLHPHALAAAHAARCAGEQGKFWELRTTLVQNASRLNPEFIKTSAEQLKLDMNSYSACMASDRFQATIRRDIADANAVGITGTPSFVIGRTAGTTVDGVKLVGAQPFTAFEAKFKELLSQPANPQDR